MKQYFSHKEIKNSNLFCFLTNNFDFSKLDFLDLDAKIIENIKKNLKKDENTMTSYFLGNEHFEQFFVYTVSKKNKKSLIDLLGKEFPKLPKNMTIFASDIGNLPNLMKTSILSRYKFQDYKSKKEKDKYNFLVNKEDEKTLENPNIFEDTKKLIENIVLARDLGNMPSNDLHPEAFAKIVKNTEFKNTKVKVFDYKKIKELKMGLLEAVGKGSKEKPHMVILERIVDKKLPTIGFVGKGVTFDTGGIQVKPDKFMYEMKGDMCGAANVFAIAKQLDEADLKVNVVYALMLAENHISSESFKPSDIFTSYSGKTVDIIHTDAEGRLVLADGISYISKNYKLDKIVSMATLTGACMVALGFRYAGIMGNDDDFIGKFEEYSRGGVEKYSRLPFDDYFVEKTKSDVADVQNLTDGVYAGSTMWAAFLANFVLNDEKYTHLDIAGPALNSYEPYGYTVKWMTGFGVESVSEIIKNIK